MRTARTKYNAGHAALARAQLPRRLQQYAGWTRFPQIEACPMLHDHNRTARQSTLAFSD